MKLRRTKMERGAAMQQLRAWHASHLAYPHTQR
jgi:hypothetical protein